MGFLKGHRKRLLLWCNNRKASTGLLWRNDSCWVVLVLSYKMESGLTALFVSTLWSQTSSPTGRISLFPVCEIPELSPEYLENHPWSNKIFFTKWVINASYFQCCGIFCTVLINWVYWGRGGVHEVLNYGNWRSGIDIGVDLDTTLTFHLWPHSHSSTIRHLCTHTHTHTHTHRLLAHNVLLWSSPCRD